MRGCLWPPADVWMGFCSGDRSIPPVFHLSFFFSPLPIFFSLYLWPSPHPGRQWEQLQSCIPDKCICLRSRKPGRSLVGQLHVYELTIIFTALVILNRYVEMNSSSYTGLFWCHGGVPVNRSFSSFAWVCVFECDALFKLCQFWVYSAFFKNHFHFL